MKFSTFLCIINVFLAAPIFTPYLHLSFAKELILTASCAVFLICTMKECPLICPSSSWLHVGQVCSNAIWMVRVDFVFAIWHFHTHHFFNYFVVCRLNLWPVISWPTAWLFDPPPPSTAYLYYDRAAKQKEWWESIAYLHLYISFTYHFFNKIVVFGVHVHSVKTLPTDSAADTNGSQ